MLPTSVLSPFLGGGLVYPQPVPFLLVLSSPLPSPPSFQDWKTDEFHVIPFLRLPSQMQCALWVVR